MILDMNAMTEATFTLKDVFYLLGLFAGGLTAWFKMQRDKDKLETKIEHLDEKVINVKHGKTAMKKAFELEIEKIKLEQKEDREANKLEFKEINEKLNRILGLLQK